MTTQQNKLKKKQRSPQAPRKKALKTNVSKRSAASGSDFIKKKKTTAGKKTKQKNLENKKQKQVVEASEKKRQLQTQRNIKSNRSPQTKDSCKKKLRKQEAQKKKKNLKPKDEPQKKKQSSAGNHRGRKKDRKSSSKLSLKEFTQRIRHFKKKKGVKKVGREIRDFLLVFLILLVVVIGISSFFFSLNKVNGYSMSPTLRNDDLVLVSKTAEIERLDLLVFERQNSQEIRRVIGLPGERIEYIDDVLYVDGNIIDEPYLVEHINEAQRNGGQYTEDFKMQALTGEAIVPEGYYFVLGDNREWARDSREYGFIEEEQIIGIVKARLLPINGISVFTIFQSSLFDIELNNLH